MLPEEGWANPEVLLVQVHANDYHSHEADQIDKAHGWPRKAKSQMSKSLFIPHGRYRFQWYGEVLYVQWIGTFNFEAMTAYMAEHKRQAELAALPRWGRIVDLREWEGITPDAVSKFNELAQWLETTRCVASAQVFSDRFYQTIAAKVADNVGPRNLAQVFNIDEAVSFLATHGLRTEGNPGEPT